MTDKCISIICTLPVETFSRHDVLQNKKYYSDYFSKEGNASFFFCNRLHLNFNQFSWQMFVFVCFFKSINTFVNCELLLDALACPLQSQFSRPWLICFPLCCFIWWRDYKNHKVLLPGDDKKGVKQTMRYNLWHFYFGTIFPAKTGTEGDVWIQTLTLNNDISCI